MLPLLLCAAVATPTPVSTKVYGSLERSLQRVQPKDGAALAAQAARLVRWRGDVIRDVHPGDRVDLLFDRVDGLPELAALHYRGSAIELEAFRFTGGDGIARYFNRAGELIEPWLTNSPVPGYVQITEKMQSGSGKRKHRGLDLKAPEGTPVRLPFDGVVSRVNWSKSGGNCVEVYFENGMLGRFLHLHTVDPAMKRSARVEAGANLGTVGNTGRSIAPHLHYELRSLKNRAPHDPLKVHGTSVHTVAESDRAAFEQRIAELDAQMPEPAAPTN